jgi:hypothetical protein
MNQQEIKEMAYEYGHEKSKSEVLRGDCYSASFVRDCILVAASSGYKAGAAFVMNGQKEEIEYHPQYRTGISAAYLKGLADGIASVS